VDCGVYICKYAQTIYQLRFLSITYQHLYLSDKPLEIITKSSSFDFTDHIITQLQSNIGKLISNLSNLYKTFSVPISLSDDAATNSQTTSQLPSPVTGQTQVLDTPQGKSITSRDFSGSGGTAMGSELFCEEVGIGAALLPQKTAKDVMLEAMKAQFYKIIEPMHEEAKKNGIILINKEKYDQIVDALRTYKTVKKKDQFMKNCWNRYALKTNVKDNLFRKVTKKDKFAEGDLV
jgi:hypothetical protein